MHPKPSYLRRIRGDPVQRELVHELYHPESSYHHDHDARSDEHLLGVRSTPKPLKWPAKELRHLIYAFPYLQRTV